MPIDEALAERIHTALKRRKGVSEKKMFGGLSFLINGNMCCGVTGTGKLVLRLGNEGAAEALAEPHTGDMDFTGRPMKSMIYVDTPGFKSEEDLKAWIERAVKFARTLPEK